VTPRLPQELEPLREMAYNMWFSWHWEAIDLFRRLDYDLWEETNGNPVLMLSSVPATRFEDARNDEGFMTHMFQVYDEFSKYVQSGATPSSDDGTGKNRTIAYFSAEYGIDECLPLYSGGLGILAGDHLKSASDIGAPLVAIGLLYRLGYFQQRLSPDGWQQEAYNENEWASMPVQLVKDKDGNPVRISVPMGRETVVALVWRVNVGRIPLYLLDTSLKENPPQHQSLTDQLYGGNLDTRIRQEILLGIGGMRALGALGIKPAVCHMNEGHSAFQSLEQTRQLMQEYGLSFWEAKEAAWASNVFTTHTPVPAGNDRFPPDLMGKYFGDYTGQLGIPWDDFMALGRENPNDPGESFCMTILALKMAAYCNGVSKLHGDVSRKMWRNVWPGVPLDELPIKHITNGTHLRSWTSHDLVDLFERYLGPRFMDEPGDTQVWDRVDQIPDAELWRTHERRRERLVAFARRVLSKQLENRGAPPSEVAMADEILDPSALTIGFARRFATYKRGNLLLRNPERLARLLTDAERPVQLIFAGKAHPHDNPGKEMIKEIVNAARNDNFRMRLVFLEDYSIKLARYMVQGCDVWLNTPRRPLEASGTSGMKAVANGAIHVSTLDGWWCEGFAEDIGWSIGRGDEFADYEVQDRVEGGTLFDLLEKEIVPAFYDRGRDGLPKAWIRRMKSSIRRLGSVFNTHRMFSEYLRKFYIPAMENWHALCANGMQECGNIARWRRMLQDNWRNIAVLDVATDGMQDPMSAGDSFRIRAHVRLGPVRPEDVRVQVYCGALNHAREIAHASLINMESKGSSGDGVHAFEANVRCDKAGRYGFAVRVMPHNDSLPHTFQPGLVTWA